MIEEKSLGIMFPGESKKERLCRGTRKKEREGGGAFGIHH